MITFEILQEKLLNGFNEIESKKIDGINASQGATLKSYIKEAIENSQDLKAMLELFATRANDLKHKEAFISQVPNLLHKVTRPYLSNGLMNSLVDLFEPDNEESALTKEQIQSIFIDTLSAQLNTLLTTQLTAELNELSVKSENKTAEKLNLVSFASDKNKESLTGLAKENIPGEPNTSDYSIKDGKKSRKRLRTH